MFSRGKTLTLTTTLLLVLMFSLTTLGATHVVSKDGAEFSSIQAAIDSAKSGDTVWVREGTYKENLSVDKDLTLTGAGPSKVKIDGQKKSHPVLYVGPSEVEVTVKNLTLQGAEGDSCKDDEKGLCPVGVAAVGDPEIKVKGVTISGNEVGIGLVDSTQATAENSMIKENKVGIILRGSARVTIKNNKISGNVAGIVLAHSAQVTLENSEITGNENTGMGLWHSAQATVQNSSIRKNEVGIKITYPESFEGTLEGSGNRIIDNDTDFEGVSKSIREKLVSEPEKTNFSQQPGSATRLARANNDFGFRLLNELMPDAPKENVFVSPLSIQLALQMTYMGAKGETKQEMEKVLGLSGLERGIEAKHTRQFLTKLDDVPGNIELSIANSIWARQGLPFNKDFLKAGKKYYEAKIEELDFGSPKAVNRINGWVSEKTHEKIKRIVKKLDPSDVMVLINALYFKAPWQKTFMKRKTQVDSFYLPDGSEKPLPLMSQSARFQYLENGKLQLIRLPYGRKGKLAAYVALPKQGYGLDKLIKELSWKQWQNWTSRMEKKMGLLELPRFKLRYEKKLNSPLKVLGMKLAFDKNRADFTGIIDVPAQNAYINKVRHKTFLEVTEQGTVAAAATEVKMGLTAIRSPNNFEMIVDHPFLFAIADKKTQALIFLGAVRDPKRID